jgi:mannose-6-phosphate isomerase-like protein (cupin superfamily)
LRKKIQKGFEMIETVENSELDNERISKILTPIDNKLKDFDFSKLVVNKPWGYEYLMYKNNFVSIWVLYIKKDHGTSMHCHIDKKTALTLLAGEAVCTTLEKGFNLKPGDGIVLNKKVFHSTQAISEEGIILMEVETPSKKEDLLRLGDTYGRVSKGYESGKEISSDLAGYEYVSFSENEFDVEKKIGEVGISLMRFEDYSLLKRYFGEKGGAGIILEGKVFNTDNGSMLDVADIFDSEKLEKFNKIDEEIPVSVLEIFRRIKNDA